MKSILFATIIALAVSISACGGSVSSAQAQTVPPPPPEPAATLAQGDLSEVGFACDNTWTVVPGLTANLTTDTDGQPVKVSHFMNFRAGPQGLIHVLAEIDTIQQVDQQVTRAIGDFSGSGQTDIIGYSRVYFLDAGEHQFSISVSCRNSVIILRGTLTVEVLP